jgi:quercetin dioxygenase-like cupin family protein
MKQLQINDHYQVLRVELAAGSVIPMHFSTSDTFLFVERGNATVVSMTETYALSPGNSLSIPAGEQYMFLIIENFKACIIMSNDAKIITRSHPTG